MKARAGNPTPRTVETAAGMLNAIGLDNDGLDYFRTNHLPYLRTVGTAVIVNIAGEDENQFRDSCQPDNWQRSRCADSLTLLQGA